MFALAGCMVILHPDFVVVIADRRGLCGQCQGATFIFINRHGRTVCWACDRDTAGIAII